MAERDSSITGVATDTPASLALAIADLSVELTRKRNLESPANHTYSASLAWNHHWDAAIKAQRWAVERNKGDEESQRETAYRLAILIANKAMPKEHAPGSFDSQGISGDAARDSLITALADGDSRLGEQAARLLGKQLLDDSKAQKAIVNYHKNNPSSHDASDF
ncbi:MAG: hypothetical protein EA402_10480 [Planctomycetota bacterium]|nr:MAG: hypothetical protein EA402_10480 [Planctomycetota bacterium]